MARKVGRNKGEDAGMSLAEEIRGLREALRQARERMQSGLDDAEVARMGTLVARLSDSLGRALLAQGKLLGEGDRSAWLRAETDRLLREMGLGE